MKATRLQTARSIKMTTDHFESVAQYYGAFRPKYPSQLFEIIAQQCVEHKHVWDCATGSGQAAVALASIFETVTATDASEAQLQNREPHDRVSYRVAPAQASGLAAGSVDVITVAQALHWFPLNAFFAECERVLKPGGILAAWTYGLFGTTSDAINSIVQTYYHKVVGPYWPPERALVDDCYRSITLPFDPLILPELIQSPLSIEQDWNLTELKGYLRSWSASGSFVKALGQDPIDLISNDLAAVWGKPTQRHKITLPLTLYITRKPYPGPLDTPTHGLESDK